MPHVIIKLLAGRTEDQKARLADLVTRAVMDGATCSQDAVSVAVEDIAPDDWNANVYAPEIAGNWDRLYKKPGYAPP